MKKFIIEYQNNSQLVKAYTDFGNWKFYCSFASKNPYIDGQLISPRMAMQIYVGLKNLGIVSTLNRKHA